MLLAEEFARPMPETALSKPIKINQAATQTAV